MYKISIEKIVGDIRVITNIETDDIMLVRDLLEVPNITKLDSDVPNRNIDPEWQDIEQRIKALEKERAVKENQIKPFPNTPITAPYVSPFGVPENPIVDPYGLYKWKNPLVVTC